MSPPAESHPVPVDPYRGRLDAIGATASSLCAVHCALTPIAVALMPLSAAPYLAGDAAEWMLAGSSAALGLAGLCLGHARHKTRWPFGVLAAGVGLLALGRAAEGGDLGTPGVAMTVAGGLAVAGSHIINRRLCLSCGPCRARMG